MEGVVAAAGRLVCITLPIPQGGGGGGSGEFPMAKQTSSTGPRRGA